MNGKLLFLLGKTFIFCRIPGKNIYFLPNSSEKHLIVADFPQFQRCCSPCSTVSNRSIQMWQALMHEQLCIAVLQQWSTGKQIWSTGKQFDNVLCDTQIPVFSKPSSTSSLRFSSRFSSRLQKYWSAQKAAYFLHESWIQSTVTLLEMECKW